jgi:hypothetical protein
MATRAEILALVQVELGEAKDFLTQDELNRGIDKALAELGYTLTVTDLQQMWLVNRAKRHCLEILLISEASSFKFNKLELQQAFDHYKALIIYYDTNFISAQETSPELFPNLSWAANPAALFGTYITNGFQYARTGESIAADSELSTPTTYYPEEN